MMGPKERVRSTKAGRLIPATRAQVVPIDGDVSYALNEGREVNPGDTVWTVAG